MTRRRRRRGQPGGPCSKGWEPRRGKLSRRALRGWSRAGRVLVTTRHRRQLARWAGRARALERAGRSLAHLLLTTHTPSHTTPRLSTSLRACLSFRLSARTRSSLLTALLYLTRRCSFPIVACSPRPPACLPAFADHPPALLPHNAFRSVAHLGRPAQPLPRRWHPPRSRCVAHPLPRYHPPPEVAAVGLPRTGR
jgi:hypothetical protein